MTPADKRKWFAFVASLPCMVCGANEVQVAHYCGMSGHKLGRGMGKKAHDLMTIPLCREHHEMVDSYQYSRDKTDHSEQMLCWIAQTIIAGYEAGVLGVRK